MCVGDGVDESPAGAAVSVASIPFLLQEAAVCASAVPALPCLSLSGPLVQVSFALDFSFAFPVASPLCIPAVGSERPLRVHIHICVSTVT